MGSVFKRKLKDSEGKCRKSARYYIAWTDATGRRRQQAAYVDRKSSMQLLAEKEREAAQQRSGLCNPFQEHSSMPLKKHLEDFEAHLQAKAVTQKYRKTCVSQVRFAFESMEAIYPDDLSAEKAEQFLTWLVEAKEYGRKTRNDYLSLLREFARWGIKRGRWPHDPFETIDMLKTGVDIRRKRRALTEGELRRLIEAAKTRPVREYLRTHPKAPREKLQELERIGKERALLYRFATLTGLRRKEIKTLTWFNLDLDSDTPSVTVEARYAKARRKDAVVLPKALAQELNVWKAAQGINNGALAPVFNVSRHLVDHFRRDCKAAQISVEDDSGRVVDFHSLRHTTATLLSRARVSPRAAQAHLRHADIQTTMRIYTHLELMDRSAASEALSALAEAGDANNMLTPKDISSQVSSNSCRKMHDHRTDDMPAIPHKKAAYGTTLQQGA